MNVSLFRNTPRDFGKIKYDWSGDEYVNIRQRGLYVGLHKSRNSRARLCGKDHDAICLVVNGDCLNRMILTRTATDRGRLPHLDADG